jgi:preprotein translocase subunit SecE
MANKDRNKRSARKARQAERERLEAAHAVSGMNQASGKKPVKAGSSQDKPAGNYIPKAERKGLGQKVGGYFYDVRAEMHKVTWPTRTELRNYTFAVITMLIIFGVLIWAVDTMFVAGLVRFTGLRG